MSSYLYTVRTAGGITFHIQAAGDREARERATSPLLARRLAELMIQAVSHVETIQLHRGPRHTARYPVFGEEFFK